MDKKLLRFCGYVFLTSVLFFGVSIFYGLFIFSRMLCGACFMTIYGSGFAFVLAILFILLVSLKIYWIIYRKKGNGPILQWIFLPLVLYFIITPIFVIIADQLNIGSPYPPFF